MKVKGVKGPGWGMGAVGRGGGVGGGVKGGERNGNMGVRGIWDMGRGRWWGAVGIWDGAGMHCSLYML